MATRNEQTWLETIDRNAFFRIDDVAKVRVGIKTTADKVFISDHWDQLPENNQPETELLLPLLSSDCASKWLPLERRPSLRVLYTHVIKEGKRQVIDINEYPGAANYLEMHRTRLEGRKYIQDAKRKWYEIWVPQDPSSWGQPKLVFPDISQSQDFAMTQRLYC
ncbi:hypothetical protein N752_29540 [Desulforamulus aquiferis]|nr:hypothetical protein N752_29540 [Desulforamulus aquiferis]